MLTGWSGGRLKREIHQELNIFIDIQYKLSPNRHGYGNFSIELIPFVAKYTSGDLQLHEHRQADWYLPEELPALHWAPADIPVLQEFLHG